MLVTWDTTADGKPTESAIKSKMLKLGCVSIDRYEYPVGCHFPTHTHGYDKLDAVISGELKIEMDGKEFLLKSGDMVKVTKHKKHAATVVGSIPCLSFDGTLK